MEAPTPNKPLPCDDIQKFQESLKKLRVIDDRIIHALNDSLPTRSLHGHVDRPSTCKRFYDELQKSYDQRADSIRHCLKKVNDDVEDLRKKKLEAPDDINLMKALRKEQTKLRLMQQEMSIEEVVKDRSLKVFYERCREHFTPPAAPIVL